MNSGGGTETPQQRNVRKIYNEYSQASEDDKKNGNTIQTSAFKHKYGVDSIELVSREGKDGSKEKGISFKNYYPGTHIPEKEKQST